MSAKPIPSFRTTLGRVRGLGSAKGGTAHWWMLRLTSIVLIPLSLYVLVTFFNSVIFGGYKGALHWAHEPPTGVFLILFLAAAFHHAASGLQEAIEDYIHCEYAKLATLLVVRFIAAVFALFGIIAVFTIQFQELIPHASGLPIY